ncbi:unnamed protein product [Ixodes hexagonus]
METYKESVWIEINLHGQPNILLGNYYFPPQCDFSTFSYCINHALNMIDFAKYRVFITGDFNLPGVNWDTGIVNSCNSEVRRKANDLSQLANYLELYKKIYLPTAKATCWICSLPMMTNVYSNKVAPHLSLLTPGMSHLK